MSAFQYSVSNDFPNGNVNVGNLQFEIRNSAITTALDTITRSVDVLSIAFKAPLNAAEKTILDGDTTGPAGGLIAQHSTTEGYVTRAQPVLLREDAGQTNGNFYRMTAVVDADSNSTTQYEETLLVNTSVLSVHYETGNEHVGDSFEVLLAPDTALGTITSDVSPGDSVISVSQSVISNAIAGPMRFMLDDGVQSESLGRIVSIDIVNSQITTENSATLAFLAATPTVVRVSVVYIDTCTIGMARCETVGESKIGSSAIPAGQTVRLVYHNRSLPEPVGLITSDVSISASVIDVDDATLAGLVYGDKVRLQSGATFSELGKVTLVDKLAKQITVDGSSSSAFLASGPTNVLKSAKKFIASIEMLQ